MYFKVLCGGSLNESEISVPSSSWEDWIFAESRRRYACLPATILSPSSSPTNTILTELLRRLASLWLLVGCVICVLADPGISSRFPGVPA